MYSSKKLVVTFYPCRITASEAAYKLCKVRAVSTGPKGVPYIHTSDGRTIRYPDPNAKVQ